MSTTPNARHSLLAAISIFTLALACAQDAPAAAAEPPSDQDAAIRGHVRALEGLAAHSIDDGIAALRSGHLADSTRLPDAELRSIVAEVREAAAAAGAVMVEGGEDGIRLSLRGGHDLDVVFTVADGSPWRITSLRLDREVRPEGADRPAAPEVGWDELPGRLDEAAAGGFSGTVLAVRDGETVLHRGYGMANREAKIAATTETIYDIGSMPIDFTRAAIFLLAQEGALSLDDPIGRHFEGVPADKRTMTLDHLMTSRSGLPNFHHVAGVDDDYDLSWVDRETAVRRILSRPLLFAPGAGRSHSHSAYGLLAAVVEKVSGKSYGAFLRDRFFGPAGMTRTGFYGEDLGYSAKDFAVGYGESRASEPNIPPKWGPTSWLVQGSGGMVSTPVDLRRWFDHLRSGKALHGESLERYLARSSAAAGGTDRGFFVLRLWDGADTTVYFATNAGGRSEVVQSLAGTLERLVLGEGVRRID